MADNQPDDTLIKILEEDRKGFHKKRGFGSLLVRLLIIAVLIFVGLYGFILFRQYRLNLEAEAIVFAKRTAQSINNDSTGSQENMINAGSEKSAESTLSPEATETPVPDLIRTGTIAAEMTSVVEFQLTLAPE